ncbi:MAG: hypothetical protein P4L53_26230 [Candidatus Obscuribacterales bacterium]|nr:hypothetical protein [Candidatus Obscuribacterales bacterium]
MAPLDKASDKPAEKQSEAAQFASAAFYAAIQKPINSALQTVEKATTLSLPRMELVNANGADGPHATNAQKGGELLGSMLPYIASRAAARYGLSGLATPFRSAASEGALAGALMGGVLTPVDDKESFWQKKAALALTDGATFGTLEGTGKALKSFKTFAQISEDSALQGISRGALRGALSGLPAGFVNAESQSLTSGHGLASRDQIESAVGQFAIFGAALGAADGGMAKIRFTESSESKINDPNRIISFDKTKRIGGEDEGSVYSNGDGTLTKVFKDKDKDVSEVKSMFDVLNSLKIPTPKIIEMGKTEDSYPAIKMQQLGNGDNLRDQLIERTLSERDRSKLVDQYYAAGEALNKAGKRIDWNLKNMKMHDGKLYIFDPSFMQDTPMDKNLVDMFGRAVGPRPEKFQ